MLKTNIPAERMRGRPKTRWKDACQRDLKSTGLIAGEDTDRAMWRRKIINHTGDLYDVKSQRKEEGYVGINFTKQNAKLIRNSVAMQIYNSEKRNF